MVIPPTTSTRAALATKAITAPCVPTTSPAARPTHRRAPKAYPDCGAGAAGSSPPWLSPLIGVIGVASRSVTAAAGGCELVTGWKRSPACRVRGRVEGLELTKTRSPLLESVQRADTCRAGPGPPDGWLGFTAAYPPCRFTGYRRPSATLRARPITL